MHVWSHVLKHEHTIVKDFIVKPRKTNCFDSAVVGLGSENNKHKTRKKNRPNIKMKDETSQNNGRKCARQTISRLKRTVIHWHELSYAV